MQTVFIEATHSRTEPGNHGKFLVGRFTIEEWARRSEMYGGLSLLPAVRWSVDNLLVLDLQTGEGAIFRPGGLASADLNKHALWVCPLYESFLAWLYQQDLTDLDTLPTLVELPDAPFAMFGHRRPGPKQTGPAPQHSYVPPDPDLDR